MKNKKSKTSGSGKKRKRNHVDDDDDCDRFKNSIGEEESGVIRQTKKTNNKQMRDLSINKKADMFNERETLKGKKKIAF